MRQRNGLHLNFRGFYQQYEKEFENNISLKKLFYKKILGLFLEENLKIINTNEIKTVLDQVKRKIIESKNNVPLLERKL